MSMVRWLALMLVVACFAPSRAWAAACPNTNGTDCDGDGMDDMNDPCPGVPGVPPPPPPPTPPFPTPARMSSMHLLRPAIPEEVRYGFQDIACYAPFLPATPSCIPVAARRFDEEVLDDPYHPNGAHHRRVGFTYVGVYDPTSGGPAASLPQASVPTIQDALRGAQPLTTVRGLAAREPGFPSNTLFACVGSVEISENDGTTIAHYPTVNGFQVAAEYAWAIQAADKAARAAVPGDFRDGLGLITGAMNNPAVGDRKGLFGIIGKLLSNSRWSVDRPDAITAPLPQDLPAVHNAYIDVDCQNTRIVQQPVFTVQTPSTMFGRRPVVVNIPTPAPPPPLVPIFRPGEFDIRALLRALTLLVPPCQRALPAPLFRFGYGPVEQRIVYGNALGGPTGWSAHFIHLPPPVTLLAAVVKFAGMNDKALTGNYPVWQLAEPRPPTPPPYRSTVGRAALSSGGFPVDAILLEPDGRALTWRELRGWQVSALEAAGLEERPIYRHSHRPGSSFSQDRMVASISGWEVSHPQYLWRSNQWLIDGTFVDDLPDGIDVTVMPDPGGDFDFAHNGNSMFSVHLRRSHWFPGGDHWLTNQVSHDENFVCGPSVLPRTVAANPANDNLGSWCPAAFNLSTVAHCNADPGDYYDLTNPAVHWPLIGQRVAMASLFGQIASPNVADAVMTTTDLSYGGVHQGLDINWHIPEERIEPESRTVIADRNVCYERDIVPDPLPCHQGDPRCECGGPFNPPCLPLCDIDGTTAPRCPMIPDCDRSFGLGCGIEYPIACWQLPAIAMGCAAREFADSCDLCERGFNCEAGVHMYVRVDKRHRNIENEMEYNVAFGARPPGPGALYATSCGTLINCDTPDYTPANRLYSPLPRAFIPEVSAGATNLFAAGTCNDPGQFPEATTTEGKVWPYTVAPGIFQHAEGIFGTYTTVAGRAPGCPPRLPILTFPNRYTVEEIKSNPNLDQGFRMEFLGDLILDCGHDPQPTEIHPPESVLLHLGWQGSTGARYSLFGWHRRDFQEPIVVDLWPGSLPDDAEQHLVGSGTFYGEGGVIAELGGPAGGWQCAKYPLSAPNRLRCTLRAGPNRVGVGECDPNRRMLPGCAMNVAGGLVDVGWAP